MDIEDLNDKESIFNEGIKITKLLNENTKKTLEYHTKLIIALDNIEKIKTIEENMKKINSTLKDL